MRLTFGHRMKQHKGMRPQDIVILLKIAAIGDTSWYVKDLAAQLGISQSEVSESLHRSMLAGFVAEDKRSIMRQALMEFLEHGLVYVYPQQPGSVARGMPTAHSAPPLKGLIRSDDHYVWAWAQGKERGQRIEPLHPSVPSACSRDSRLHELLSLADVLRVGRAREKQLALTELRKRIA